MERLPTSPATLPRLANRRATTLALATAALLALLGVAVAEAIPSPVQNPLRREITGYKNGQSDFFGALQEASYKYGVPLGIEADAQGEDAKDISVSIPQGTVADIFNALVQQAPNYKWVETGGVVNVIPRRQNGNSVLDIAIARFRATNATPDAIHSAIISLPEVKAWLNQNQLVERGFHTPSILVGKDGKTDQPRVSLSLKNMTLRQIMDTIVKKSGFHVWFVGRYDDHRQYLSISID